MSVGFKSGEYFVFVARSRSSSFKSLALLCAFKSMQNHKICIIGGKLYGSLFIHAKKVKFIKLKCNELFKLLFKSLFEFQIIFQSPYKFKLFTNFLLKYVHNVSDLNGMSNLKPLFNVSKFTFRYSWKIQFSFWYFFLTNFIFNIN